MRRAPALCWLAQNPETRPSTLSIVFFGLCAQLTVGPAVWAGASYVEMPDHVVRAQGPTKPRVVLLRMADRFPGESWSKAERLAASELRALGFEVTSIAGRASDINTRMGELGAQATAHQAVAALRIVRRNGRQRAQVWLYDALTEKMVLRETTIDRPGEEGAARVALRVVELMHASLLEVKLPDRIRPTRPVPGTVQDIVRRRLAPNGGESLSFLSAWLTPSLVFGVDKPRMLPSLRLGGAYGFRGWLAAGAELSLPLVSTSVDEAQASVDITLLQLTTLVRVEPWSSTRFSPAAEFGLGLLATRVAGQASAPSRARTNWRASFVPSARLRLAVGLWRELRLVALVGLGRALPHLRVRVGPQTSARIGRLLVNTSLGLEWRWGNGDAR